MRMAFPVLEERAEEMYQRVQRSTKPIEDAEGSLMLSEGVPSFNGDESDLDEGKEGKRDTRYGKEISEDAGVRWEDEVRERRDCLALSQSLWRNVDKVVSSE